MANRSAITRRVKRFDITVRLQEITRTTIEGDSKDSALASSGALVPLYYDMASVRVDEGYSFVRREQLQRGDPDGRAWQDVDGFVRGRGRRDRKAGQLPPGYWVRRLARSGTSNGR